MNEYVYLTNTGVSELALFVLKPTISEAIFGDFSQWCTNLIGIPINVSISTTSGKLKLGNVATDVDCYEILSDVETGYNLGEYYYSPKYNDYRDYEPYASCEIILPYYGTVALPVKDVLSKYIEFRMNVDLFTGQAMYIIGVSDTAMTVTLNGNNVSLNDSRIKYIWHTGETTSESYKIDDSNTRVLGTYAFQLGYQIPFTRSNVSEIIRNVALSGVKSAGDIIMAYGGKSTSETTYDVTATTSQRNQNTGRLNITDKLKYSDVEKTTTYKSSAGKIGSTIQAGAEILSNFNSKSSTDKSNNSILNVRSNIDVIVLRKYAKVYDATVSYKKLYGMPLGEPKTLGTLKGYTEISAVHLENQYFNGTLEEEKSMINSALLAGVIFPEPANS